MPLYKRRPSIDTGIFITTGQTGQFFPVDQSGIFEPNFDTGLFLPASCSCNFVCNSQTGCFLTGVDLTGFNFSGFADLVYKTGFPSFGYNPSAQNSGESIFSNSSFISGSTQYSFYICSAETQGDCYDGSLGNSIAYLNIPLPTDSLNQAWLIKNNTVAVGDHWNGTPEQQFANELVVVAKSSSEGSYSITSPVASLYAKSQPEFNVCVETTLSGIRYRLIDSPNTKMKWTSKIEVIQTISQDIILDGGIDESGSAPTGYLDP
jgi:hypothetical protein